MVQELEFDPRFMWHISLLHIFQNGCAVYKAPCNMGTKFCSPVVKRKGQEIGHALLSSAVIKNMWLYLHFLMPSWYCS